MLLEVEMNEVGKMTKLKTEFLILKAFVWHSDCTTCKFL